MKMIMAESQDAKSAYTLVRSLQKRFADKLSRLSKEIGQDRAFEEVTWLRDEGIHGGGSRFESRDELLFNTGSVNVSQVHYDEMPEKNLKSATAISTIIHPKNPHVPSIHIHISLTELRDGSAYWRVMADLNPSILNEDDKVAFDNALRDLAGGTYTEGKLQGEKYFDIPALGRKRGVSLFYLENYKTEDKEQDLELAKSFGEGIIDKYVEIITAAFKSRTETSQEDRQEQLNYHTLYLFQVLTLDRGTTSGLLIHNQNDVGIMGSLPSHINRELLKSWAKKVQTPQDELVLALADVINDNGEVNEETKIKLAQVVREHYTKHQDALSLQASGNSVPKTVGNHTD
ncbi:coproporphyrinogen III oxidase [Sulfurimonas sp. SAG-AH-194-C21]|nr:coproporphyrinogen III oxidase [Sulfurimonas sp. SAG-AH-194-C21]MDF1882483.1 coproporphyrinogen III oxidase [Sulfurimonas sp. SAG-AH-194-C21]